MVSASDRRSVLRAGAVAGTTAWLLGVGVALTLWWLFGSATGPLQFLAAGIVFYYAFHLWPALPLVASGNAIFAIFAPVAMLVLLWAGFRTAMKSGASTAKAGFTTGSVVVVGYFAMTILSLPAFAISVETSPLADPLTTAVVVGTVGLVFPIVFGGAGGWLAGR